MEFTIPYVTRTRFTNTEGVNESWRFKLEHGIGKDNTTYPYVIVNEWISANIAHFLQLPIAPFGLFKRTDRRTLMFGSVSFEGDVRPRNAKPSVLWRHGNGMYRDVCTGVVVLDILIANSDRHKGNIKVDNPDSPSVLYIFDHDRTLLHVNKGDGLNRLKSLNGRLGISAGAVSGGNRHCLIDEMDTSQYFPGWLDRVYDLPRTLIDNVCRRCEGMGASKSELAGIAQFLEERKRQLPSILAEHRSEFPNIHDWPLMP